MTERLIGVSVRRRRRRVGGVVGVRTVGGLGTTRAVGTKGFVGVGCLFGRDTALVSLGVVVGGTAGAAAGADDPKETGSKGEGGGEPRGYEDVLAHGAVDAILLEFFVEEGGEDGEECCSGG